MNIEQMKRQSLLIGIAFMLLITTVAAFTCPDDCSCMEVQRNRHSYNHAKCTTLDGLRQLGKTSDLHSLDLSNINLTKITNQLDKLTNLTKIDLHDNRLSEINNLSTKRVRILNLSNNRITSGKLTKIPIYVKHLNLTHNDITYLPLDFKKFIHLKSLELAENPVNCTCETLEIRNWLQEKLVWTDKPILCMSPLEFKGRPWLQIRQSDVCEANGLNEPRTLPYAAADDENDLMHGDDPNAYVTNSSAESIDDVNDELETEYLSVKDKRTKRKDLEQHLAHDVDEAENDDNDEISDEDYVEGSGSNFEDTEQTPTESNQRVSNEETYEGSGDELIDEGIRSFGLLDSVPVKNETSEEVDDDVDVSSSNIATENVLIGNSSEIVDSNEDDEIIVTETESTQEPIVTSFGENDEDSASISQEEHDSSTGTPVIEEPFVAVKVAADTELIQNNESDILPSTPVQSDKSKANIKNVEQSQSTYILLGVVVILLVVLIMYVATKRSRTAAKNRRNNNDIEQQAQELSNMDKNNLGKPINANGEFIPLIPGRLPVDKENNLCNAQEPLLKKLAEGDNNEAVPKSTPTDTDQTDLQTPNTDEIRPNGNATVAVPLQNGGNDFQPISPKPSRYSPVRATF